MNKVLEFMFSFLILKKCARVSVTNENRYYEKDNVVLIVQADGSTE